MGSKNLQQILKELGSECVDWNNMAQDTDSNMILSACNELTGSKIRKEILA